LKRLIAAGCRMRNPIRRRPTCGQAEVAT
jgi:hypothetical protein